jgi:hypothetical protein
VEYFEAEVEMNHNEAVRQLNKWKTDPVFIQRHMVDLQKKVLELPLEHVIFCEK